MIASTYARAQRGSALKRRLHTCGAPGCNERIGGAQVFCRAHWNRTPRHLRDAITTRIGAAWSAAVTEARKWHADNPPAALAVRMSGDKL